MKLKLIIGFAIFFTNFVHCQNIDNNLKKQIVEFYYSNRQIQFSDKQNILDNFDKLIVIQNISSTKIVNKETPGFYEIRLSITHTEIYLLEYNNVDVFKIYKVAPDNLSSLMSKIFNFIKLNKMSRKKNNINF